MEMTSNASALSASIVIDKPPAEVFRVLIEPTNIDKISEHIGNVRLEASGLFVQGAQYKRILYSHGLPNPQTVLIEELVQDQRFTTQTELVGWRVTYRYELSLTPDGKTLLSLTKAGHGGWPILEPLMVHLLTRPEHDGGHLLLIKQVAEAGH